MPCSQKDWSSSFAQSNTRTIPEKGAEASGKKVFFKFSASQMEAVKSQSFTSKHSCSIFFSETSPLKPFLTACFSETIQFHPEKLIFPPKMGWSAGPFRVESCVKLNLGSFFPFGRPLFCHIPRTNLEELNWPAPLIFKVPPSHKNN